MSETTLHGMLERWRDRANEPEYKLHREWAIDQCADELQPLADQLQAVVERMEREGDKFAVEIQTLLGRKK